MRSKSSYRRTFRQSACPDRHIYLVRRLQAIGSVNTAYTFCKLQVTLSVPKRNIPTGNPSANARVRIERRAFSLATIECELKVNIPKDECWDLNVVYFIYINISNSISTLNTQKHEIRGMPWKHRSSFTSSKSTEKYGR